MSKKIDAAAEELVLAVYRHAAAVGAKTRRIDKISKANSGLIEAANAYTRLVYDRTELVVPFGEVEDPENDVAVRESLARERNEFVAEIAGDERAD